jgi:anaerobic magnesium-protoporphyrin IX monomethyl ester cyclase
MGRILLINYSNGSYIEDFPSNLGYIASSLLQLGDWEDFRTVRPVTPYPGSQLYNYAIEKGLLNGVEDFYENKHINSDLIAVNFTDLSNEEFMFNVKESNKKFAKKYYELQLESKLEEIDNIDENFRGYR